MDRLYPLVFLALLSCFACDPSSKTSGKTAKPKSRVNAVVAKVNKGDKPSDFCDTYTEPETAITYAWPPLDRAHPDLKKGWTWLNVWATWCEPCIEEMPRLLAWQKEMAKDGLADVVFISADDTAEVVTEFRKKNPDIPDGERISEGFKEWQIRTGFDAGAPLPLHVFVDPQGKVRCVRAGGVSENNKASVARLIRR